MKATTRYQYEKRIRNLTNENENLRFKCSLYEGVGREIYSAVCEAVEKGNTGIRVAWLVPLFKRVWR